MRSSLRCRRSSSSAAAAVRGGGEALAAARARRADLAGDAKMPELCAVGERGETVSDSRCRLGSLATGSATESATAAESGGGGDGVEREEGRASAARTPVPLDAIGEG